MADASNTLSFATVEQKTVKAQGLTTTASNVVETLADSKTEVIGDVLWATSVMVVNSTGRGNTKRIVYSDGAKVYTLNPSSDTSSAFTIPVGVTTFPASLVLNTDYDFAVASVQEEDMFIWVRNKNGAGQITIGIPLEGTVTIEGVGYRCNSNASEYSAAIIAKNETDYVVLFKNQSSSSEILGITPETGSKLNVFVDNTYIAVVETKADGTTIVRRALFGSNSWMPVVTMQTNGITGKLCNAFVANPVFYGYKADGYYAVVGSDAPSKMSNTPSGITGTSVFTTYSSDCTDGYIYRQADGVCRDQTTKRTDAIVGTMTNDYLFNIVKMTDNQTVEQVLIDEPIKDR